MPIGIIPRITDFLLGIIPRITDFGDLDREFTGILATAMVSFGLFHGLRILVTWIGNLPESW